MAETILSIPLVSDEGAHPVPEFLSRGSGTQAASSRPSIKVPYQVIEEVFPAGAPPQFSKVSAAIEKFNGAARELFELVRTDPVRIEAAHLKTCQHVVEGIGILTRQLNQLCGPLVGRDREVLKFMLPALLSEWKHSPPAGNAELAMKFLESTLKVKGAVTDPATPAYKMARLFFQGYDVTPVYPTVMDYLKSSKTISAQLPAPSRVEIERDNGQKNYLDLAADATPVLPPAKALKFFQRLTEEVKDLAPEEFPQLADQLSVRFIPVARILEFLAKLSENLETGIAASLSGTLKTLSIPLLGVREKKLTIVDASIDTEENSLLAAGIGLLAATRKTLGEIARFSRKDQDSASLIEKFGLEGAPLLSPEGRYPAGLFAPQRADLTQALTGFFATPVCYDVSDKGWQYPLARLDQPELFRWAISGCLKSSENAPHFLRLLRSSLQGELDISGSIISVQSLMADRNSDQLGKFLNGWITDTRASMSVRSEMGQQQSTEFRAYSGLALLVSLAAVAEDEGCRDLLAHGIPEIQQARDIAGHLEPLVGSPAFIQQLLKEVLSKTGPSLDSCNLLKEDLATLKRVVSNFHLLQKNPQLRHGLDGNEIYRSGILLSGDPGTGKTYLVNVLEVEMGARKISLKPFRKKDAGDLEDLYGVSESLNDRILNFTKEVVQFAETGQPCILEIDEAEHFLPVRTDTISQDRRDICVHLLEFIHEIRVRYPNVLVLVATNYPDKVDVAGLREGRIDYEIELQPPDERQRTNVLKKEISRYDGTMATDQLIKRLVEVTEGWSFVGLKQTVNEYFLFECLRRKAADNNYVPSFDDLRGEFERVRETVEKKKSRVEKMTGMRERKII